MLSSGKAPAFTITRRGWSSTTRVGPDSEAGLSISRFMLKKFLLIIDFYHWGSASWGLGLGGVCRILRPQDG